MRRTFGRPVLASSLLAGVFGLLPAGALADGDAPGGAASEVPAAPAVDASARARSRYDAGTQAFSQGRFVEAALEFEAAAAEKASSIALWTAALSWERANAPERSADDYARALALGGLAPDSTSQSVQRLATLEAVLGAVKVTAPPGWRAQLDTGTELPLPGVLHGAAGVHTLAVHPLGRPITRLPVVLTSGATTRLDLPGPEAQLPTAQPTARRGIDVRRAIGLVALGAAGVAILSGVLLGVEALDARDAYNAAPAPGVYDHALSLERWTDVAWITGGVLLAGGLVLELLPSTHTTVRGPRDPSVGIGLCVHSVFVRGAF